MKHLPAAFLGLALAAAPALAGPVVESEPNNSIATADSLGTFSTAASILVQGSITPGDLALDLPGDVDFFTFTLDFEAYFFSSAFGIPSSDDGDAQLALISGTTIITGDDDSGVEFFPSLEATLLPGTYVLALTGYNDLGFPGPLTIPDGRDSDQTPHTENFQYGLLVGFTAVPAPSAAALLGLGGLVAARRRR